MIDSNQSLLLLFTSKLGLSPLDNVVQKALKSIEKGIPISHILAEVLLYSYLKNEGYQLVSVEETVGVMKCDIYAKQGNFNMCIEVETIAIPLEYILDGFEYIVAKHVKKVIQATKSSIDVLSFAYPFGVIPLIPLELLKNPEDRVKEELLRLFNITKKFFSLDIDDLNYLGVCRIGEVYVYDLTTLKVKTISKEKISYLIHLYMHLLDNL